MIVVKSERSKAQIRFQIHSSPSAKQNVAINAVLEFMNTPD